MRVLVVGGGGRQHALVWSLSKSPLVTDLLCAPGNPGIAELARWLDMEPLLDRRTEGFSQGERMKVAIARTIVHDPPNILLDEPTNGLDVMTTRNLREIIRRLRDAGKCVLFSSHVMQEVSALCDEIVIVARGSVVARGNAGELLAASGRDNLEDAFVRLSGEGT